MHERTRVQRLLKDLDKQSLTRFPKPRQRVDAPDTHGVYMIRSPSGRVLHVGRTVRAENGLRQRLTNHLRGKSSFVRKFLSGDGNRLRKGFTFQYLEVPESRLRVLLEYAATVWHCPAHLGDGAALQRKAAARATGSRASRS